MQIKYNMTNQEALPSFEEIFIDCTLELESFGLGGYMGTDIALFLKLPEEERVCFFCGQPACYISDSIMLCETHRYLSYDPHVFGEEI